MTEPWSLVRLEGTHPDQSALIVWLAAYAGNPPEGVGQAPPSEGSTSGEPITYTVRENETLVDIAAAFGLSVEELAAFNFIDPDELLRPGQVLLIPPP
jgi:LysM repeat protein